jgi:thiol:disulfide interchange protein DsbD
VAFPLFATTAWLVWVLAQQAGADAVLRMLIGLTLLAVAAWVIGRWNPLASSRRAYRLSRGLAAACAVSAIALALPHARGGADRARAHAGGDVAPAPASTPWGPWSADRVAELRRAGRAVFVDFTAAWCLTCQVNERVALSARTVRERLRALDVATLKADWTSRDSAIARALAGFGRSSVPLYVLYPRDARRPPALLPTLLTPRIVIEALERAK